MIKILDFRAGRASRLCTATPTIHCTVLQPWHQSNAQLAVFRLSAFSFLHQLLFSRQTNKVACTSILNERPCVFTLLKAVLHSSARSVLVGRRNTDWLNC